MSALKIQGQKGISGSIPANDSQTTEVPKAAEDSSSGSVQQMQEMQQAVEVAKSRLAENQTIAQRSILGEVTTVGMYFNPKEITIDKAVAWQNSPAPSDLTSEVETASRKDAVILYNGHAGLGENK